MTLKTLKDISGERFGFRDRKVSFKRLKAEAVKCLNPNLKHMNKDDFIVWFFNLTEEDLK